MSPTVTDAAASGRPSVLVGVSCDYHDAAACVVVDGRVVAAAEEERFTRVKHDASLPERAVASCLAVAGVGAGDVEAVVFHEKPLHVATRVVAARQRRGPAGVGGFVRDVPLLLRRNLWIGYRLERLLTRLGAPRPVPVRYGEHHLSHAAAAFYPSPHERAAVLTVDGIGEWATASIAHGVGHRLEVVEEVRYPDSLGLLYSLATRWIGFEPNDGEYKLMGLAPYGSPTLVDAFRELLDVHDDGSFSVDGAGVGWWSGDPTRSARLRELLGPPRAPDEPLEGRPADVARSVQVLTEEVLLGLAARAMERTGEDVLCLAGGVALNCVANGRIIRSSGARALWVQPAAGDAGSAIGAALWYHHDELARPRTPARPDGMSGAALGPAFSSGEIGTFLAARGVDHDHVPDPDERSARVAAALAAGAVVGWFSGRMEFGPRALGHRSLLADPRSPEIQRDLNLRVKGRESFRPFAPAVLADHAADWFDLDGESPYMLVVCPVRADRLLPAGPEPERVLDRVGVARSSIPACTHVDGSARVQTVDAARHPEFHRLLSAFHDLTGCPVLLNTSFNRAGEPIVCTPADALDCAAAAGVDLLVLEDRLVVREHLPA